MRYYDRRDAGRQLGEALATEGYDHSFLVLGLARGGIPVAYEAAQRLDAMLDVMVVRKLGVPWQPELAFGALGPGGSTVINESLTRALGLSQTQCDEVLALEQEELERRLALYRNGLPPFTVENRKLIVIDDGLATGASMQVACGVLAAQSPAELHIAVPLGTEEACRRLASRVTRVICLAFPDPFLSVGTWYRDFRQTSDEEVIELLHRGVPADKPWQPAV